MRNRWVRWLLILALLVLAPRFTLFRRERVPVTVYRVAPGPVEETVTNSCTSLAKVAIFEPS